MEWVAYLGWFVATFAFAGWAWTLIRTQRDPLRESTALDTLQKVYEREDRLMKGAFQAAIQRLQPKVPEEREPPTRLSEEEQARRERLHQRLSMMENPEEAGLEMPTSPLGEMPDISE